MARSATSEERLEFVKYLLRAASLVRRHTAAALKPFKLSPEEWIVLEALSEGVMSQGDLAKATLRDRATLSRACDGLVRKRLVGRGSGEEDKRVARFALSERGREVLVKVRGAVDEAAMEWTPGLSSKEAGAGYAAFRAMHELVWDP